MRISTPGQLIQLVEDLVQCRGVQRPDLLDATTLIECAHLKYERDRWRRQAVLLIRLNDHRAGKASGGKLTRQWHDQGGWQRVVENQFLQDDGGPFAGLRVPWSGGKDTRQISPRFMGVVLLGKAFDHFDGASAGAFPIVKLFLQLRRYCGPALQIDFDARAFRQRRTRHNDAIGNYTCDGGGHVMILPWGLL